MNKMSEFMRELRKDNYSNIAEKYFKLGNNLNQRDAIAVRKLISGFIKLIYPVEKSARMKSQRLWIFHLNFVDE